MPVPLPLWHLAHAADWEAAQAVGEYRISTRGRTLEEEGFIHCAYPHQLGLVARGFYADDPEPLVLLAQTDYTVTDFELEEADA